jgi:type I restriction enzyme S subunit
VTKEKKKAVSIFTRSLLTNDIPKGWSLVPVGSLLTEAEYGLSEPGDAEGDTPIVGMKNIGDGKVVLSNLSTINSDGADLVKMTLRKGDILLNRTNSPDLVGKVGIVREDSDAVFASYLVRLKTNLELVDAEYLNAWLNGDIAQRAIKRISTRAVSQANVNPTEFQKYCPVLLPDDQREQVRVAAILHTWDEAIEKLETLIHRADRQVSSVRQRLFEPIYLSRKGLARARAVFETVSDKARPDLPLLAVMQDIGIVRRDELDRRVAMPDGETSGYKVVRPGDFVISLRSFEGGLELSNILGLVSPAYTVLRPIHTICLDYFKHYFKSRSFIGRLDKMIFGIRDGKQIAFRDFGDMFIPCPSLEVQKAHAEILNTASQIIETAHRLKTALERQKRGLMQKLLTGEWRVKC